MLPDGVLYGMTLASGILLLRECSRVMRFRSAWRMSGIGLDDPATRLGTVAAIAIEFPALQQTAEFSNSRICIGVIRTDREPIELGKVLASSIRRGEHAYRIEHDTFAVALVVDDYISAARALARLGSALNEKLGSAEIRIGGAISPDDGFDFLSLAAAASERFAPLQRWVTISKAGSDAVQQAAA